MAPRDRSALHLDLLHDLLFDAQTGPGHAEAVGAAYGTHDVLECGETTNRDIEAASFMQAVLDGADIAAYTQHAADLYRAAVRLFTQASAESLCGNDVLARAMWDVASALCGIRPLKTRTPDRLERLRAVFVAAMPDVTVSFEEKSSEVWPTISRAPTNAESVAILNAITGDDIETLPLTRGLRTLGAIDDGERESYLQFTVAGETMP